MHGGQEQHYPVGRYVLRSYEAGRKVYKPVGTLNPVLAVVAVHKAQKQAIHEASAARLAISTGAIPQHAVAAVTGRGSLKSAIAAYLEDCKVRGIDETCEQQKHTLNEFLSVVGKETPLVRLVTQQVVNKYHEHIKAQGNNARTCRNKLQRLTTFFKFCKIDTTQVVGRKYLPKVERELPHTYTREQVSALLAVSSKLKGSKRALHVALMLGLHAGLREREIMFSTWDNVRWDDNSYVIREKENLGFTIKNRKQREVPLSPELKRELLAWRKLHHKAKPSSLIVPTRTGAANQQFLMALKRLVHRNNLNCDECDGCKRGECYQWTLHALRRTWVTAMLSAGFDANSVRDWAGHKHLDTTLLYAKPTASAKSAQEKMKNFKLGSV